MRPLTALTLPVLLILLAFTLADQQPLWSDLKSRFAAAKDYLSSAASVPIDAGASEIASKSVYPLTWTNWRSVLTHSGATQPYNPPEAWMIYITGNKTCGHLCGRMDRAWNESVALFSTDASAPHLASVNCDKEELLCGSWAVRTGSVWFVLVPPPPGADQSAAPTHITIHGFNLTTVSSADITRLHTRKEYLTAERYEGALHPFDGWVQKYGLVTPMAWGLLVLSKVPSWAFVVAMSFISRRFMARKAEARERRQQREQAARPQQQQQQQRAGAKGGKAN